MTTDPFDNDPEHLATFVQEYVRREGQPDAGVAAVVASQLRMPQWLPHQVAEMLLARSEIQAAIRAAKSFYKPPESKDVSADSISLDMEDVFQQAMSARQFTAAIGAKKIQAEILGILTKHIDINVRHTLTTMTDSELEAIAKRGAIDAEFTEVRHGLPAILDVDKP